MTEPTIRDISDGYVDDLCAADPFLGTYLGVAGSDGRCTDLSPDGLQHRAGITATALAAAEALPEAADPRDRVAAAVLIERLSVSVARDEAGFAYGDLNVLASEIQNVRQIFDLMDTSSDEGWAAISERMSGIPDCLDGLTATYREGIRRGIVPAVRQVVGCAKQADAWAGTASEPGFFRTLAEGSTTTGLGDAAKAADAAYGRLAAFLRLELAPAARATDPVGRGRYALASRDFLGAEVDLEETYAWGWDELIRLGAEQERTAAIIVGHAGATLAEAFAVLDADQRYVLHGSDALQAWMQQLSDRTLADFDGVHFDLDPKLRTLRCAIAPPGGSAGMYYTPPNQDWSRPGTMWWSLSPGQDTFHTWTEVTTVFHEGVPGHHLQCAQAVLRADLLTKFQSQLCFVSGHGEGWALYAERLMADLGYLDDPGDKMGMLDAQAMRAARVVMDIGAHLQLPIPKNPWGWREGEMFDATAMRELMSMRTNLEEALIVDEVARYLGWPGQAPSYKVGERVWLDARDAAKARHGAAFDLKAFHTAALDLGPMGLDPLKEELARL